MLKARWRVSCQGQPIIIERSDWYERPRTGTQARRTSDINPGRRSLVPPLRPPPGAPPGAVNTSGRL
eukprot:4237530-Pyramimonas_sp.AAC.1